MTNYTNAKQILSAICSEHALTLSYTEACEALNELYSFECDDSNFELEGRTFRIIHKASLEGIWEDELEEYCEECILSELPDIAQSYFDMEAWVRDAKFDGVGHHFGTYDGTEIDSKNFSIFLLG